ncbi:Heat shock 70 kDa protein cognate 4 [Orchesella cincta]|uniref:Heat shock 70 kDa protein cognate 4 n=1 Tax=Orchesella cincta TaxID=48709 RepID=A0A1D2M4L6_ORCCI|nr:Heat shock 70 kDa protein cognate 4 [Orchesella cincta]
MIPPEQISAILLANLKSQAESSWRAATKDAAEMAGLEVLTILNEPTAAAIAYKMEHFSEKPKKVLVFDLGGDSDSKPKRENARRMIRRLQTYCEKAKSQLSSAMHATISVDGLAQGHDFHEVFSRTKFEELNKTLFRQTIEVVDKALEGAKLKKKDIDDILLVGGSTRIPKIKEMLSKHFNNKTLSHSVHPDIAVAYGAAIQAALLNGKKVNQLMVVIPKNTKIPHRATESFRTSFKNQDFMRISVYQGDDAIAANNNLLGTFELSDIPPSKSGKESVDVTMEIDKMGILQVTAMCRSTQETQSLIVQSNKDRLSEAEKQKISNSIRKSKVTQKYDGFPDNKSSDDESTGGISSDDEPIKKPQSFKNQSAGLSESSSDSETDDLEEW